MSSAETYFDPYGQSPPPGEWNYILDDFSVHYGPGWWPFYRDGRPCGIRVSPDTDYRAWRNEYVTLRPGTDAGVTAKATLHCRPQGLGAIVVDVRIHIDLRARTTRIVTGCPDEVREQAETKATRLLAFLVAHRRARRQGEPEPVTAHQVWTARDVTSR
ncbi:hypothetical protein E1264_02680 [Actinomadura sp. KC216]|uniref:hypothetical protein n=1 Tax=unclassified Actinomadura TaxID=2626254 RepID=UPI00104DE643|nr:hypothetical protein [Actinomadura sp. KC216]TDB91213.1 hypothetical protein E1264_02680 [Actinomadura sp. KC216]